MLPATPASEVTSAAHRRPPTGAPGRASPCCQFDADAQSKDSTCLQTFANGVNEHFSYIFFHIYVLQYACLINFQYVANPEKNLRVLYWLVATSRVV